MKEDSSDDKLLILENHSLIFSQALISEGQRIDILC
jgi:hypothetical protein